MIVKQLEDTIAIKQLLDGYKSGKVMDFDYNKECLIIIIKSGSTYIEIMSDNNNVITAARTVDKSYLKEIIKRKKQMAYRAVGNLK